MANDLPAYLQNRSTPKITNKAAGGIGGALPPHVSIRGNRFTLVDAAGNKQPIQELFLDGCFVDVSDVMCKQYYEYEYEPDSNDPPTCWSANGVAPSREASSPQAPTCAACPKNERGSAHSKQSGKPIKACRDEKWAAFQPVKYPTMLFQMKITPGSFKAWSAYVKKFEYQDTDLSDVVTRVTFQADTNGQLVFVATTYIDETMYKNREAALSGKKTDILVGRNDVPRQGALAAPVEQTPLSQLVSAESSFGQTAPAPSTTPVASAPNGGSPPQQRRKRRTAAEIAADKAAAAPQGQASAAPAAPVAPFRPASEQPASFAPASSPASSPAAGFGIASGVAPNPELQATINTLFGKQ